MARGVQRHAARSQIYTPQIPRGKSVIYALFFGHLPISKQLKAPQVLHAILLQLGSHLEATCWAALFKEKQKILHDSLQSQPKL